MLRDQQSGGNQHRNLFALLDGLEGCPEGNLGFAIAHITCKQSVHGNRALHVSLNLVDGGELVGCLLKLKGVLELLLPGRIGAKGMALALHASGVELYKVNSYFANRFARVPLGPCPVRATHLREHRCLCTDIPR